ncbi:G-protein coupled receptor family C group 6 member A-like [Clytia hemisphaerica]|uniref:G-protein coupled receptor family C group 6 member A-like n=1 Tax=Clytia hemisphaerica TaxID=252671 RepID=UPI0034D5DE55
MRDRSKYHDANQCTYNQNKTMHFLCWQGIPEVETSHCSALNCEPGFYRSYEKIEHGFSWICVRCQKNHHKPDFGNHLCYPCEGRLSIANGKRTACLDPYTNIFVSYQPKVFYIIGVISSVGSLTAILTLIIFVIKRNTPIVTTSDFKVSTLHISIQAVTMIIAPFLYFMNHNCVSKPLVFTTLYTLDVGIVFIKSQKLLQAFLCKVKLTAEEAKRAVMTQIMTIVIFLVSVNAVFFVCLYQQQVTILEFEDPQEMTREYGCNTYFHSNVIMIAIAVIQLMCAIQAFRGRHFPSVMNDGVVLMFTTLILTASFVVCFIIVPFQRPIEKEISQCIAILANTMVITFLMYGLKAYRILFHPEQNTRAYFRNQCLTEMRQDVNQRIEMR